VTEVVPMKKMKYSWKYDVCTGGSFVAFELFKQNNFTRLKLTHNVPESFAEDIPQFSRENCIGG
jgi:hypothetical protein